MLPELTPLDSFNQKHIQNTHPGDYTNPAPADNYNLVVIGAGTAGLVTASVAAGLGAKVALIERHFMGGDCLNTGCVPSKALIRSARAAAAARDTAKYGVTVAGGVTVDFPAIMERMRRIRSEISPIDSVKRYTELGVDVFLGQASFVSNGIVSVKGQNLNYAKAVICTGARAAAPDIPGLQDVGYLTNETLFNLTELPPRLLIIGSGAIGCEMAQTFAAFGSQVTLITSDSGVLAKEDPEAAAILTDQLEADGVDIRSGGRHLSLTREDGAIRFSINAASEKSTGLTDQVLVATGRQPNVEHLNLESVQVAHNAHGVTVNDYFKTTNSDIFAAGDICSRFKFTHAADFMARAVVRNALFFGSVKQSDLIIPWCTYTTPEVAHIGPLAKDLDPETVQTFTQELTHLDRALLDGETHGFIRIHVKKGTDTIIAATIVSHNAGDMISQVSQAMTSEIGLGDLANSISPYPTQAEAIRKLGDAYNKKKYQGSTVMKLLGKIVEWRR